jgi:hypothetical protein
MHVITCIGSNEDNYLGTMMFFQSFSLFIMIEDSVQELWRRWTKASLRKDGKVALWKKAVGFVWVMIVLCLVSPWFGYSTARLPHERTWVTPYAVTEKIGIKWAGVAIGMGALISIAVLKPEI